MAWLDSLTLKRSSRITITLSHYTAVYPLSGLQSNSFMDEQEDGHSQPREHPTNWKVMLAPQTLLTLHTMHKYESVLRPRLSGTMNSHAYASNTTIE